MTSPRVNKVTKLANACVFVLALIVAGLAPVACNTTEGFGKDLKAGGEALEDAARDAND